mmetsp:Transcript_92127/g.246268  ORF Transcript_92127/g.246268 Transcript_92127/m.246268 type:complete len:369 (-) Transcript_92127:58-1164(-)
MSDWCTIESDPGVFTELCEQIGVSGVEFTEVYSLEEQSIEALKGRTFGLIFLFKWMKEEDKRPTLAPEESPVFFAKQVITNACATQAILSVLLNAEGVQLGPELSEFKAFTSDMDYEMRGLTISNSESVKKAHNSFQRMSSFEIVQDDNAEKEDAFHFISYIWNKGKLYELDGLKAGPILIGESSEEQWLSQIRPEIQRRMQACQAAPSADGKSEIRFNLMAIVEDQRLTLDKAIMEARHYRHRVNIKLVSVGEDLELDDDLDEDDCPASVPAFEDLAEDAKLLQQALQEQTDKIAMLKSAKEQELQKREKWRMENARRRHDFVPFVLCAMKHLARKGKLTGAYARAHRAAEEAKAQAQEKKAEVAAA